MSNVDRLLGLKEAVRRKPRTHAWVAVDLPPMVAKTVTTWSNSAIKDEDLYSEEEGEHGRQRQPHVTVKWGLTDLTGSPKLRQLVAQTPVFVLRLGLVSLFKGEEFDVVKLDVVGKGLNQMNAVLSRFSNEDRRSPAEYQPHCTLAYVKPGTADHLVGTQVVPNELSLVVVDKVRFAGHEDVELKLKSRLT